MASALGKGLVFFTVYTTVRLNFKDLAIVTFPPSNTTRWTYDCQLSGPLDHAVGRRWTLVRKTSLA
jgi:hypothetical protein